MARSNKGKPGPPIFDNNLRTVFAFREIGKGFKAIGKASRQHFWILYGYATANDKENILSTK